MTLFQILSSTCMFNNYLLLFVCLFSLSLVTSQSSTETSIGSAINWLGVYSSVSNTCIPSNTCCCAAVGKEIIVEPVPNNINEIFLSGESDGGAGCYHIKSMNGTFNLLSDVVAEYNISQIDLTVNITLDKINHMITIESSRTSCPVEFQMIRPTSLQSNQAENNRILFANLANNINIYTGNITGIIIMTILLAVVGGLMIVTAPSVFEL